MKITDLFEKPCIIGLIGNPNEAKSNALYETIIELRKIGTFKLCTYGLKKRIEGATEINSVNELEQIRDSIIFIDEVMSLFDLDDRKIKKQIENTLRLIFHNNNILVLCFTPENVKKFISSKLDKIIYKKVTFDDFINGSSVKKIILNYQGYEKGTRILNLGKSEAIIYDGLHYHKTEIPYLEEFDTKKGNIQIVQKNVPEKVEEINMCKLLPQNERS
jgi:hypothetical protein